MKEIVNLYLLCLLFIRNNERRIVVFIKKNFNYIIYTQLRVKNRIINEKMNFISKLYYNLVKRILLE